MPMHACHGTDNQNEKVHVRQRQTLALHTRCRQGPIRQPRLDMHICKGLLCMLQQASWELR